MNFFMEHWQGFLFVVLILALVFGRKIGVEDSAEENED